MLRIVLLSALLVLTGCSPFKSKNPDTSYQRQAFTPAADMVYGHGSGQSERLAIDNARRELAEQIFLRISSEVRIAENIISTEEGSEVSSSDFNNLLSTYSNVQLAGSKIELTEKTKSDWYARVSIPSSEMDKAKELATQQAPALAYIHLAQSAGKNIPPATRLRYALHGLNAVYVHGIEDQILHIPGVESNMTFEAYFRHLIELSKDQLVLLPLLQEEKLHFSLLDKISLQPQTEFVLKINDQYVRTNNQGMTPAIPLDALEEQFSVWLTGYHNASNEERLLPLLQVSLPVKSSLTASLFTNIYVGSQPAGALITVKRAGKVLDERPAPAIFTIDSSEEPITLSATAADEKYRNAEISIGNYKSINIYKNFVLTEKRMGTMNLSVPGRNNLISITSSSGQLMNNPENSILLKAEAGHYAVKIARTDKKNYQTLTDTIVLQHNQTVERRYQPPIYRSPYTNGRLLDLNFGMGTDIADDFEIEYKDGSKGTYKELIDNTNLTENSSNHFQFRGVKFFNTLSLALSGGIDYRTYTFKDADGGIENSLDAWGLNTGLGFWTTKFIGSTSWLTLNYSIAAYQWEKDKIKSRYMEQLDSFTRGFPYIEAGIHFEMFGLGIRLVDPEQGSSVLYIAIGGNRINNGYRHPAQETARSGVHF